MQRQNLEQQELVLLKAGLVSRQELVLSQMALSAPGCSQGKGPL